MRTINDFDLTALWDALEAKRQRRGLSWQAAAREINAQFSEAGARINVATIRGLREKRSVEADGVLQMLQWLGLTPESLVAEHPLAASPSAALPRVPIDRILRFDTKALHGALDVRRRAREMSWVQVADEIGGAVTAAGLTRLADGARTSFPHVMRVLAWLDRPVAAFSRSAPR